MPQSSQIFDTVVVGAGLAGIAASVTLARAGQRVALIEAKRRLGGRATSFDDQGTGELLDNCQHVTLGCCTEYLSLCSILGVRDCFTWEHRQWWAMPGGKLSILTPSVLPAPLHYAPALLAARFLTLHEKLAIAAAIREIMVAGAPGQYRLLTFNDYLRSLDQPQGALDKFWSPIIISACNMRLETVSAAPAIKVFQDGFLPSRSAGMIGLPGVPLAELYSQVPAILGQHGGVVVLGEHAEHVSPSRVVTGSNTYIGRNIISALPLERAAAIVKDDAGRPDTRLADAPLTFSPILGVHIAADRPVLRLPHAVLVGMPTQWVFRKSRDGRRIHAVISAADDWLGLTQEEVVKRVMRDVILCFPGANGARVLWARAVKERRATFGASPAFEDWRSRLLHAKPGYVTLAGDYTNTEWPATMEGAVRSGIAAAHSLLLANMRGGH